MSAQWRARKRYINRAAIAKMRETIFDIVGPASEWPRGVLDIFTKLHIKNKDRFTLTVFLLGNGLNPVVIKEYYAMAYAFDKSANTQIDYIIGKYPKSFWTTWNVHFKKSM